MQTQLFITNSLFIMQQCAEHRQPKPLLQRFRKKYKGSYQTSVLNILHYLKFLKNSVSQISSLFEMLLSWTHFLSKPAFHSVFIYFYFFFLNLLLRLCNDFMTCVFCRALNIDNNTQTRSKKDTLNAKLTWCVLCTNLERSERSSPISSSLLLLSRLAYPFFPQLCYISLPLSVRNSFSFCHDLNASPPPPQHSSPYFTIWKVTQSFPSRVFADRKSIFNEVTFLLKCF